MRVIILADFAFPTGGAQKVAIDSACALAREGVSVVYIHAVGTTGDPALEQAGVIRIGLGFADIWDRSLAAGLVSGVWHKAAATKLRTVIAPYLTPDSVLHLHQYTRSFSPAVFPVLAATGRPVAVTLHDYFLICPNGLYYRFDTHQPCTLTPLSVSCLTARCDPRSSLHKAVRALRSAATRRALAGLPLHVVHVSDKGEATSRPFLPDGVIHHRVDNPVGVERQEPARIKPDARIAYIGRMTREKGADLVARAATLAGMPALFIGEGPLVDEIRAIAPTAEIIGWQSPEAVARLLRGDIRAVAAPSRWPETGPLTIYEALAAGVPAIASNRSGAAEKVVHGKTGFVVAPDEAAMADAFAHLKDIKTVHQLGGHAHQVYWADPPTPKAHALRLSELYHTMLGSQQV
jgi:glycosyltransferase involved in cell wall biosynthesis